MTTMIMMMMGMVMMMANRAVKARGQIPKRPIFQVRLTTRSPFYLSIHIGRQFIGTEIHILEIQAFLSFSSNPYSIYFRRRLTLNLSIFISIHLSNVGQMFILKFYFNSIKFWSSINSGSSYMDIISLREMFIDFFARFHMVCDRYTSYFDHFIFFQHNSPLSLPKKGKKSSHTFLVKNVCFLYFSFAASNQFFVLPGLVTFSEQMTSSEVFTFLWGGSRHVSPPQRKVTHVTKLHIKTIQLRK